MRIFGFATRQADDRDMAEEMRFHIEALAQKHERAGMSPQEALRRAHLEFGSTASHAEDAREKLRAGFIERLFQDLRYGVRIQARTPVLTLAAIGTLALGIGGTAALFSLLDRALFRSLPVDRPEEMYAILRSTPREK